jgi:peptidoglycan/LPS O-acetylase OafA/YrhL
VPLSRFTPHFFWKRFWRIVPPFLVSLIFSYLLAYPHPFAADSLRKLLVNATLLKTLVPGYFYTINYAHWSVAAEWQLYLVYPFFLYLLLKIRLSPALAFAWATCVFLRFVAPHFTDSTYILNFPFNWWFEWTLGVLIAEKREQGKTVFRAHGILTLVLLAATSYSFLYGGGFLNWLLPRLLFAVVVEYALILNKPLSWWERVLVPVGLCSYSIYLFHLPFIDLYWKLLRSWQVDVRALSVWVVSGCIMLVVTCVISGAIYKLLELKCIALGERLWRKITPDQTLVARSR